jgi:hypothetical protein
VFRHFISVKHLPDLKLNGIVNVSDMLLGIWKQDMKPNQDPYNCIIYAPVYGTTRSIQVERVPKPVKVLSREPNPRSRKIRAPGEAGETL